MNFMLCQNLINLESLFKCFYSNDDNLSSSHFKLIIDRKITNCPLSLDQNNTRMSLINTDLIYINNAVTGDILPPIFTKKKTKGFSVDTVIHHELVQFYKTLLVSTFSEKMPIQVHLILNDVHILLSTIPNFDNKNKVIAATLIETPFLDIGEKY